MLTISHPLCKTSGSAPDCSMLLFAANNELQIPPNVTCACPNEVLTFTCTTVGSGATIWSGSAFQCSTGEIILRHNAFAGESPQSGNCEDIVGESVGVQGNCYTSRLHVPVSAEVTNRTVRCLYNSDTTTLIDEVQISVITGNLTVSIVHTGEAECTLKESWK